MRSPAPSLSYSAWVVLTLVAAPLAAQAPVARPLSFWFTAWYGRGWAEGLTTAEEAFSLGASVQ